MAMKRIRSWICLMSIASFFCVRHCLTQCDSFSESGITSLECSVDSPNISLFVDITRNTNPELRELEVTCTDLDRDERLVVKNLEGSVYQTLKMGSTWNYSIPKFPELANSTNVICEMTGCFYSGLLFDLPTAQCSIQSHTEVFSTVSSIASLIIPSPHISVEATTNGSEYIYEQVMSTSIHAPHQPTINPSREFPSLAPTAAADLKMRKGQYYISVLVFPVFSLILVACAVGCITKQRMDSKRRKKDIQLGNWIINDNLQDVTPINLQKAIIHPSASYSTLYSGLLFHNLAEATFVAAANGNIINFPSSEESWQSDHYSSKDVPVQPTVNENVDASNCSVYGNNAAEGTNESSNIGSSEISLSPGYIGEFPDAVPKLTNDVASFEDLNDDQYVFYNRDREEEDSAMDSELNFDHLADGNNSLMFLSANGYIQN